MDSISSLVIALIANMSVVVVVAYVITRTRVYLTDIIKHKITFSSGLFLAVVFGAFSIYGTVSAVKVNGAYANIRDLGPAIAGLVGGPWVGLCAGLVGATHRFFDGGLSQIPCSIATVIIGLAAGLIQRKLRKPFIGVAGAVTFMVVAESFHMLLVLALARPFTDALMLVKQITIPMLIANACGIAVFSMIIMNLIKEQETQAERDAILLAKEHMESELRVARDIQMSMIPKVFEGNPPRDEYELYATLRPAKEVGGDLYDFFMIDENQLFFTIGDVSDKGVPAALFMAMTKTLLKGLATPGLDPSALLTKVNAGLVEENESLMFVTLMCGVIDLRTGKMQLTNAGHNPPLIVRADGSVEWLKLPVGMVLGVDPDAHYTTAEASLAPGEMIVAYTDGVTEAMSPEHKVFSDGRLHDLVRDNNKDSAKDMVVCINDAVTLFADSAPQSDDITTLAIRYVGTQTVRAAA
ncbi:MAG: SpoIIE family protein phosphatase [Armatimonadota bacterium]|nr:SpoIIE family protein phosphatase [bacterium]